MNVAKILVELRSERERVNQVILALERLLATPHVAVPPKKRGRPPKALTQARTADEQNRPKTISASAHSN